MLSVDIEFKESTVYELKYHDNSVNIFRAKSAGLPNGHKVVIKSSTFYEHSLGGYFLQAWKFAKSDNNIFHVNIYPNKCIARINTWNTS